MDRIDRLKERYDNIPTNGWRTLDPGYPYGDFFDVKDPKAVLKRFPYITIMDRPGIEKLPICIRKALAVKKSFCEIGLRVEPEELIVGSTLLNWKYCEFATPEERDQYIHTLFSSHILALIPDSKIDITSSAEDKMKFVRESGYGALPCIEYYSWIHTTAGFKQIVDKGYLGIAEQSKELMEAELKKPDPDKEKCDFWKSVIICCEAVAHFSNRYAFYLEELAVDEADEQRKQELIELADICRNVPARPPRSFHEAVQSVWFSLICTQRFVGTDIGRLDQIIYPFYKSDIEKHRITPEKAQELIECLWIKLSENILEREGHLGLAQNIILSGKNPDGSDCTNDVTYMCLNATKRLRMITPKVSLRIHKNSPQKLFKIAREMLLSGLSMPDFYNDEVAIPAFVSQGATYEDAHEYVHCVCEETMIGGMSEDRASEVYFLPVKSVELALNNGVAFINGKTEGAKTGDVSKFQSFDEFFDAYEQQIMFSVRREVDKANESEKHIRFIAPQPLHSASIVGCVESGKDSTNGGCKYNNTGTGLANGLANAVDSLYTIKRLVFEEKKLTLAEYVEILKNNFKDNELLRQYVINKYPKYGNDIDEVDALATKTVDIYLRELKKYKNLRGGVFKPGTWGNDTVHKGREVGASADGRPQSQYLSLHLSPVIGKDSNGVTAVIKSASKVNVRTSSNGGMLDIMLNPVYLCGDDGVSILDSIVRGYFDLGGFSMQFNVIDAEVLKEAKKNPEKYRHLMVRVWGYSDYFVKVDPAMQENIIARAIHAAKQG